MVSSLSLVCLEGVPGELLANVSLGSLNEVSLSLSRESPGNESLENSMGSLYGVARESLKLGSLWWVSRGALGSLK